MLELSGLSKRYGDVVALDGVDLRAVRGRIVGFLGPNGAGKTTAMRSVFGLVALDAGTVSWDDAHITGSVRRRFGYLPEHRGLYPKMRIARHVAWLGRLRDMDRDAADHAARGWLEQLGLGDRLEDRVDALSHGNQQRVQLAACLVHDPELLVLDEPFSGLDPVGTDAMIEVLRARARAGTAVVLSSHQLDLVEDVCEDVVIINSGRLVLTGSMDEVKTRSPHRRVAVGFREQGVEWKPPGGRPTADGGLERSWLVPADSDPTALLADATAAGDVVSFSFEPPRLSELFREAVRQ